jgi:hypothetical protein
MESYLEKKVLIVGMPATGKTSFLAALQNYIEAYIPDKALTQYKYSPNAEYLNKIHTRWLDCKQQPRTIQDIDSKNEIEMFLEDTESKKRLILKIPDVAGEAFAQHWLLRSWDENYKELVETSDGLLFFIHPGNIKTHSLITDVACLIDEILEEDDEVTITHWDPNDTPTQVVSVDILQQHLEYLPTISKVPIAFIISAWDKVIAEHQDITPLHWLKINMPLLYQYAIANNDLIEFSIYGVSAQGGDFIHAEAVERLQEFEEPADRVIVQEGGTTHKNISAPIQWIMNRWKS